MPSRSGRTVNRSTSAHLTALGLLFLISRASFPPSDIHDDDRHCLRAVDVHSAPAQCLSFLSSQSRALLSGADAYVRGGQCEALVSCSGHSCAPYQSFGQRYPLRTDIEDTHQGLAALNPSSSPDPVLVQALAASLGPNATSNGNLLQSLTCSGLLSDTCIAICPNQDLAGIGVRIAFYFQSLVSALLVVLSPSDSVPTAWAGTLLTGALVVAAMVSKASGNLTLHHATLVLNFATLSCISSLAVAPMLPIWRLTPGEYFEQDRQQHALGLSASGDKHGRATAALNRRIVESAALRNARKREVKRAQRRARMVLSLALLIQVVLQWAWGVYLFTAWTYSQPACSADTTLVLFLASFRTRTLNSLAAHGSGGGARFFLWPVWLLFCLGTTLALTVVLALSGARRAAWAGASRSGASSSLSRAGTTGTPSSSRGGTRGRSQARTPTWTQIARDVVPAWADGPGQVAFWCNVVSFALWTMFVAASELQKRANCVFAGEDSFGGLGQITAVGVCLVPLWSLAAALYKYPAVRKRQRQQQRHLARAAAATAAVAAGGDSGDNHNSIGNGVGNDNSAGRAPHSSDASSSSTSSSAEQHEMQPLARHRRHYHPARRPVPDDRHALRVRPSGPRVAPVATMASGLAGRDIT